MFCSRLLSPAEGERQVRGISLSHNLCFYFLPLNIVCLNMMIWPKQSVCSHADEGGHTRNSEQKVRKFWVLDDVVEHQKKKKKPTSRLLTFDFLLLTIACHIIKITVVFSFLLFRVPCLLLDRRTFYRWPPLCVLQRAWMFEYCLISYPQQQTSYSVIFSFFSEF